MPQGPAPAPAPMPPPAAPAPDDGLPSVEPEVRVGLVVDSPSVRIGSSHGFTLIDPAGREIAEFDAADRIVVRPDAGGDLAYGMAGGAGTTPASVDLITARPASGGTIEIAGNHYRGAALIRVTGPGALTAINTVDMEAYLLGVVPREIGRVGDELLEAAKAQAVAARTYAIRYLGRREALGFDVFATVQDQVYGGVGSEHEPVSRAVRATAGEILTYNGRPIEAFYHSTCAGQTAAIEEVWPTERPRPYLVSVVDLDPGGRAYDRSSNRFTWTQSWTADQLTSILNRTLADSLPAGVRSIGEIRDIEVLVRTESDRIERMRISTSAGDFFVGGDRIRWIFLTPDGPILNSSKFDIELIRRGGEVTEIVATGGGWGHGIGMCQVGAMGRARAGQDYRTILQTYYTGTDVTQLY
jgi:stage II sporulation protein D